MMRAKNPWHTSHPTRASLIGSIVLFILIAGQVNADESCQKGCSQSDNGPLQYTPGNVYEYNYDSIMTVGVSSGAITESDDTSLKVTGTAKLYAEGNCGYTLQLSAVKVTNTKESVEKKILQTIQKPVHFTMVSGALVPEICSDAADTAYALNIKRAIISLLQSSKQESDHQEVDVFGQCITHTSVTKVGNAEIFSKVRNLNGCAYREQIHSGFISGVVNEKSGIKSTMLLKADYTKESKILHGLVENVQLVEEYKFTGAPKGGSTVHAKVVTILKLKQNAGVATAPATGTKSASIIFQRPETYTANNIVALKAILSEIVELTGAYVKKDSAKSFVELIRLMRNADTETLLELAAVPHPNKVQARKVYLDALFRTHTAESARAVMKQLNKMDDVERTIAVLSLNLVESVDKDTLTQAVALLAPTSTKEIFLSIGNLIGKYCRRNNGCSSSDIDSILKKFIDNLKHCKANTKKEEERIVYILKGIGNTQHVTSNVAIALNECASPGHSTRIRVAALQAIADVSCDDHSLQKKALELLKDHNEDSELRIEAYLTSISCPSAELANEIAAVVNSESVYQVGGFITSNLKAIRDSTDNTREAQRHFLGNIRVTKSFPKDFRRYSFNNEVSYKLDALGLSASSDYKLIYSQHGFLPRSARLNLSTEVFGTNFNVFEASVRQENIESVLEYYIGPKGLLNKDFDEIVKLIEVGNGAGGASGRTRRSIADDSAKIARKYKTYGGNKNTQDLNLDMSLKLFGSELTFMSLGDYIPNSLDDIIKHFSEAIEKVKKEVSSFNKEFVMHSLFMDTELTYPTGAGVPLTLSAQGFAANKLSFGINVDIDAIMGQNWQQAKYRLKFVPSVDVNINVQIGFNAHVLSTGLRVISTLHSATGGDVNLAFINGGNGFNVDLELPRDTMELLDLQVSTEFYVAEQDKPLKSIPLKGAKKRDSTPAESCFNQFEIVGFSICFASSSSISEIGSSSGSKTTQALAEELHLSRPFSFSVYMTSERKFNFKGQHIVKPEAGAQQWKLDFSTPGSKEKHDTSLTFELGTKPRAYGRLSLDNPQYHFGLETGINNDNKELVLYGQYEQNDDVKKSKIGFTKNGKEYRPLIEIQDKNGFSNDINGYHVDGKVVVQKTDDKQARYNFENFEIRNKDSERVVINGWIDVGPAALSSELHIAPDQQSFLVKTNFKMENGDYNVGFFVNDEKKPENVYGGSAQITIGQQKYFVKLVGKAVAWEIETETDIEYTKPETSNSITSSKFQHKFTVKNRNKLVGTVNVNGMSETNKFELLAEATRDKKLAAFSVKFSGNQRTQYDYALEVNGKLNKHFVDLVSKCDINGNHYVVDNVLTTSWGASMTAKGEVGQRFTPQDIFVDLTGSAQFSGREKPTLWQMKIIGSPEKTNSEFKLTRGENAEVVKFTAETQHPQDKLTAGKVNLVVKNVLIAKGDFKLAKNGKGELIASVETQKTEPKHKFDVDSKFHIQSPKFDIETTLTLDNDKKLYFKTENVLDKLKFSTKNLAEIAEQKIMFDASGSVKGEWRMNGEVLGNFALTVPDGRIVEGSVKRKVTTNTKTGIAQGNMELQINDQLPNNGHKRSLAFNGKIEKFNVKVKEFAVTTQIVYSGFDGKNIDINYQIKHLPKGTNDKMLEISTTMRGTLLSEPLDVSLNVDEYNTQHAVARIIGKYGNRIVANFNGNYVLGGRGTPTSYEVQGNLQAPDSTFKSFDIKSNGKYTQPSTEEGAGQCVFEFNLDQKTGNQQFLTLSTAIKGSQQQGAYNLDLQTNGMQGAVKIDGSYQREQDGSIKDGSANGKQKYGFNFSYGEKYIKSTADVSFVGLETGSFHYTLDTSFSSAKAIDVNVRAYKIDGDSYAITVAAKQSGETYDVDAKIYRSSYKKGLEVRAYVPNGKPIVVVGVVELLGERKAKFSLEIENLADLDLKLNSEASYSSIDDFYALANWNSMKLKMDQYNYEIRAQGKTLTLNLKNSQGVIFSGSATYALKKEKNKAVIDGQGQIQYQGKTQNTNFKLIRQVYDINTDKEIGFSYTFNGNFGSKNGVSTLKITNKDFNIKLSVCEEKKQCTNVQVQSIVTVDEQQMDSLQHALLILIDLRELGYPYEFELQSKTIRQGFKYQYSLNLNIISNNNMKYQLNVNLAPTNSKIQLQLPNREILLETQQQYPTAGKVFGNYKNSIEFYIDKTKNPNDITRLVSQLDITGVERMALNAKGEVKFEHPTIRTLTVTGKLDANREQRSIDSELIFDMFRMPEQQVIASFQLRNTEHAGFNITSNQQIRSTGLQFNYQFNGHSALNTNSHEFSAGAEVHSGASDLKASAFIFGNKERVDLSVYGLNEQIIHVVGEFNKQKYTSKLDAQFQIFGQKPVDIGAEFQPTFANFEVKRAGLIDAKAELKLGKELKFDIKGGADKQLFNGRVALDTANFLQTSYKSSDEDVKAFLISVESEVQAETEETKQKIKQRFQKLRERLDQQMSLVKNSAPDFKQLEENYNKNVNEIVRELQNDQSLTPIIEALRTFHSKAVTLAGDIARTSTESYKKVIKSFMALFEKLEVMFKETVLPAWEEFMVTATKITGELRIEIINLYTKTAQSVLTALEKYGPAVKNYGKAITELLKPINEAAQELFKVSAQAFEEVVEELQITLAKLPTFEALRAELEDKLQKFKLAEKTLELLNNVFDHLHILPQTPESTEFLKKVHEYLEAKLKKQSVNDEELVEELFKLLLKAVRSIWTSIEMNLPTSGTGLSTNSLNALFSSMPLSLDMFTKLPALLTFRFSVLNYILNENWDQIFSKDLLKSWIFFNDFKLRGHIADGRHIFTFDGQHFSYPGTCKYILAQDSVDNNFTVIAQLNNGKLKAIILADRDGNYVEVSDAGVLKSNGQSSEYPHHAAGMHAWRMFYTIWLRSEYGVEIMCTSDLKVCHVNVNGFYTSKMRGLMGNGNAEPFDDFVQIDGTLATDYAAFGNGYGLGKCAALTFENVEVPHADICNEIFGFESPLAFGYLVENPSPYRIACDIAVRSASAEKDKEGLACTIATAYGSALKMQHKFAMLPPRCIKCSGAVGQRDFGQEFSMKIPTNKADIVFVVDLSITQALLHNLVAPAITEVRETLKSRGFTDVQIGVVVFNETQRYPALLTSDNGKINYQGNLADVQLNGPKTFCDNCVSQVINEKRLLDVYKLFDETIKSIVPQSDELAFRLALNYPFRAGAAKSIIGVRSDTLEYNNMWKFIRAHATGVVTNFDGALLHMIGPVKGLSLEGVPAEKLVGFNSRLVATVDGKDNKKRPKLNFLNDMGIDFVLNNGGWVFATQNFDNLKPQDQKKVLNQVTGSIADTLFKTEIVTDCRCLPVHGLHAQHKCVIKSSTFVPNKKVKAA